MKTVSLLSRLLLGLIFTVFGLNGFFHFLNMPMPTGVAGQYMGALFVSHYLVAVFFLQLVGGVLLLAGRFVPVALVLLGPVVVNILLFHSLMAPQGLPLALLTALLFAVVFTSVRPAFSGLLAAKA